VLASRVAMRRHAGSFVTRRRRLLASFGACWVALALAGGCAQIIGLPDDTLCGPAGAGGCGGGAPGSPAATDAGPDAPDAQH
jgi:hypothetical protein